MIKSIFLFLSFFLCVYLSNTQQTQGQNASAQQQDPAMQAWKQYMTPGEQQNTLSQYAGDWKGEINTYTDPSKTPVRSTVTIHMEMILGGRYLTSHYAGNMMGMPWEGMGTLAYDNGTKMYYSSWVDNMGTGITYLRGTKSQDGRSIEFRGTIYDPMQGKETMMRQVLTLVDANHQRLEFFTVRNGKEMKPMDITMSR